MAKGLSHQKPQKKEWALGPAVRSDIAEGAQLNEQMKDAFLRRYDKLVKRADRLNPPPKRKATSEAPPKNLLQQPTPRRVINCLQRRRDEVLRFISDLSVPFDSNGSERELRMVKLQQKISGCFSLRRRVRGS